MEAIALFFLSSIKKTRHGIASLRKRKAVHSFPIRYPKVWEHYKRALSAFWVPGEVDLSGDPKDWQKLTDSERHFLSHVLAFFASSDGIVCDNLVNFTQEVTIREVKCFYDLQKTMENVHNEMYSPTHHSLLSFRIRRANSSHRRDRGDTLCF